MHTCIHAYMHTCIHAYMHTYVHTYIRTYVHTYIHTCIHIYIHACMHAYILTYIRTWFLKHILPMQFGEFFHFPRFSNRERVDWMNSMLDFQVGWAPFAFKVCGWRWYKCAVNLPTTYDASLDKTSHGTVGQSGGSKWTDGDRWNLGSNI